MTAAARNVPRIAAKAQRLVDTGAVTTDDLIQADNAFRVVGDSGVWYVLLDPDVCACDGYKFHPPCSHIVAARLFRTVEARRLQAVRDASRVAVDW